MMGTPKKLQNFCVWCQVTRLKIVQATASLNGKEQSKQKKH